jgi:hypothetical protein
LTTGAWDSGPRKLDHRLSYNKYYLTKLGRTVVTTALKLRELFIIPSLNEVTL